LFRPRIIPVLLLQGQGLVKTVKFSKTTYIGDPINAVRIFNDLGADELIFLDISATIEKRTISMDLVKKIGDEAFMPFSVGGGISSTDQIGELLSLGAEKIVLNTSIIKNLKLIEDASLIYGNQSIVASIDIKKGSFGNYNVFAKSGKFKTNLLLKDYVNSIVSAGAGELFINSIDRDGTYQGYDLVLIKSVTELVSIPVIACGGASSLEDFRTVHIEAGANACAAGSLFVYHGPRKAVLINYPDRSEISKIFRNVI
jgi:imidazole glycerol-phosphate synthase subunit HisF